MNIARKNITVTRDDIIHGKPRDPFRCPVSRACEEQFRGHPVAVYWTYMHVGRWYGKLPDEARNFVIRYDTAPKFMRYFMRPFTFSVEFMEWPSNKPTPLDDTTEPVYQSA